MSEKKFYWIKVKTTFLTSETVDFLMSQKDGANYVVLYQMLCLITANTNGELGRTIGEVLIPYDEAKITRECKWFSIDTVRIALNLYEKLGLVYQQENGLLRIANFSNIVGSETKWANYKRLQRGVGHSLEKVQQDIRYKSIDIRDKSKEERKKEERKKEEPTPPSTASKEAEEDLDFIAKLGIKS